MRNFLTLMSLTCCLLLSPPILLSAQDFQIGQAVILQAKKPIGVPLHREPVPNYLRHVPTGTSASIQNIAQGGQWLLIKLASGETHWVHQKYLQAHSVKSSPITQNTPSTPRIPSVASTTTVGGEKKVWKSKDECQAAVSRGLRMVQTSSPILRVGTWNLRWFPTGSAPDEHQASHQATDLDWLICVIRWMQIDILAIQESLATPEATQAWKTLTKELSAQAGETWRWHRQPCGRPDNHHVGLLWNDSHVMLSKFASLWEFNAKAQSASQPCTSGLRPGQYAYVQSRQQNGADFHLISVHLKSGPTVFALESRQKTLNRIDRAVAPLLKKDKDVVILGDFNTMGAGDRHSQKSEQKYLRRFVRKEKPGFTDLPAHPQCSHYFRGRSAQLDHVLVANEMKEITVKSIKVSGYCALSNCNRIKGNYPLAYRRLSDHCPVVLEIANIDKD